MHIKFLPYGQGSGKEAIKYLLAEKDHQGKVRAEVTVLRGNPRLVGDVIDSLDFKQRYTSGVIAWCPEDKPSNAEVDAVLNDFEKLSFSGLEPDRTSWTAVKHCDHDGGIHVHIVAARVDLNTGKSLNIAPPGWQKDFDSLRDYHNYKNDWARPDDPSRSRIFQPGHRLFLDKKDNPKQEITDYLVRCVEAGIVSDREGVKEQLASIGEITRAGKNYISVKPEGFAKALRLKGGVYDEKFDARTCNLTGEENSRGDCIGRGNSLERAGEAKRLFEEAVENRRGYNARRYQKSRGINPESIERTKTAEHQPEEMDNPSSADRDLVTDSIWSGLSFWDGALGNPSNKNSNGIGRRDNQGTGGVLQFGAESVETAKGGEGAEQSKTETIGNTGYRSDGKRRGFVSDLQKPNKGEARDVPEHRRVLGRKTGFEVRNDRDRTFTGDGLGGFAESVSQGHREFKQANRKLFAESRKLILSNDRLRKATAKVFDTAQDLVRRINEGIKKLGVQKSITKSLQRLDRSKDRGLSR